MIKATGIIRNIDGLGRIVIPIELRKAYGLVHNTLIDVHVEDSKIILTKYNSECVICGKANDNIIKINDKIICSECHNNMCNSNEHKSKLPI